MNTNDILILQMFILVNNKINLYNKKSAAIQEGNELSI